MGTFHDFGAVAEGAGGGPSATADGGREGSKGGAGAGGEGGPWARTGVGGADKGADTADTAGGSSGRRGGGGIICLCAAEGIRIFSFVSGATPDDDISAIGSFLRSIL